MALKAAPPTLGFDGFLPGKKSPNVDRGISPKNHPGHFHPTIFGPTLSYFLEKILGVSMSPGKRVSKQSFVVRKNILVFATRPREKDHGFSKPENQREII